MENLRPAIRTSATAIGIVTHVGTADATTAQVAAVVATTTGISREVSTDRDCHAITKMQARTRRVDRFAVVVGRAKVATEIAVATGRIEVAHRLRPPRLRRHRPRPRRGASMASANTPTDVRIRGRARTLQEVRASLLV